MPAMQKNPRAIAHPSLLTAVIAVWLSAAHPPATYAQEVFRGQSPNGTTVYSDQSAGSNSQRVSTIPVAPSHSMLPPALQQASARYPVKIYVAPDCAPCTLGRNLLNERGIPYQEINISTAQDQLAAQGLGIKSPPHLTIGAQALKGFDSQQWAQYLSAAGYPEISALPAQYRQQPARHLAQTSEQSTSDGIATENSDSSSATPIAPAEDNNSSTGFRF
ncbi:glutaredoxin family protein [Lampropedia puyangensis]|nr:glutaredoxin family protein [Lampropedia puyangensis]